MAQAHEKLESGLSYFHRQTQNGTTEVKAIGTVATLAALDDMHKKGYTLVLNPKDTAHWPFSAGKASIFYMETNNAETLPEEEKVQEQEGNTDSQGEVQSEGTDADAVLAEPDWATIEKLNKQAIEDLADEYVIQLDTSMSKAKMMDAFKAAYEA